MSAEQSVIIVGGGVVGICSGLSLIEAGCQVTLIDRDEPGQGASFGNAGVISPWSIVPQALPGIGAKLPGMLFGPAGPANVSPRRALGYLPWLRRFLKNASLDQAWKASAAMHFLCSEAPELYRGHLQGTGQEHLVVDSLYVLATRDAARADLNSLGNRMRTEAGAESEALDRTQLHAIEPALAPDFEAGILVQGQARALDPGGVGRALAGKLRSLGGSIVRAPVERLEQSEVGWRAITPEGPHEARKLIVTAGAWSMQLLRPLGFKAPLAAERGYHLTAPKAAGIFNNSIMDMDFHFVASSMNPGARFAGLAEFAGADDPPNPRMHRLIRRLAQRMAPEADLSDGMDWMGVRPAFPDSLPLIAEIPGQSGLFGAFGHGHCGFMMAPKTGRVVADLVTEGRPNHDLSAYHPARF